MPWEELEEAYAPQFNATIGAPAKPVRLAFGALYIKQRLGLTDEETVDQIRENPYIQFFLGFEGYTSKKPFDPSMMVHFRKRLTDDDLRRINELVVQRGKEMLLKELEQRSADGDQDGGSPGPIRSHPEGCPTSGSRHPTSLSRPLMSCARAAMPSVIDQIPSSRRALIARLRSVARI